MIATVVGADPNLDLPLLPDDDVRLPRPPGATPQPLSILVGGLSAQPPARRVAPQDGRVLRKRALAVIRAAGIAAEGGEAGEGGVDRPIRSRRRRWRRCRRDTWRRDRRRLWGRPLWAGGRLRLRPSQQGIDGPGSPQDRACDERQKDRKDPGAAKAEAMAPAVTRTVLGRPGTRGSLEELAHGRSQPGRGAIMFSGILGQRSCSAEISFSRLPAFFFKESI